MSYPSPRQWISLLFHVAMFVCGCIGLEVFLCYRRKKNIEKSKAGNPNSKIFEEVIDEIKNTGNTIFTRRRIGVLAFGLSCQGGFGFALNVLLASQAQQQDDYESLLVFWTVDVVVCFILLYLLIPAGLCHKYIGLYQAFDAKQKLTHTAGFVLAWNIIGYFTRRVLLAEYFFQRAHDYSFIMGTALNVVGLGLYFVGALTGFSCIYIPYSFYITRRDVYTARQLDMRITDACKAIDHLESELACIKDDSYEIDLTNVPFYRSCSFNDVIIHMKRQWDVVDRMHDWFKRTIATIRPSFLGGADGGGDVDGSNGNTSLIQQHIEQTLYLIREELKYLEDIKHRREQGKTILGKLYVAFQILVTTYFVGLLLSKVYSSIWLLFNNTPERSSPIGNGLALQKVYKRFTQQDVVYATLVNGVVVSMLVDPPTYLEAIFDRLSGFFLFGITVSNIGNFLDFGRIMLRTKYLQKRLLVTDNTLGLALGGLLILTIPSQFCLIVPYMPNSWRAFALEMIFDKDVNVWLAMRHYYDFNCVIFMIFTAIGLVLLHRKRTIALDANNLICNV